MEYMHLSQVKLKKDDNMETWKDVVGYEGCYQVSSLGRVKSLARLSANGKRLKERMLSRFINPYGYPCVKIGDSPIRIHTLVAMAFIPNPENKKTVNHINGNKRDNKVENLEWLSIQENMQHAVDNSLTSSKLTKEQWQYIGENFISCHSEFGAKALAERFGVSERTIRRIAKRKYRRD